VPQQPAQPPPAGAGSSFLPQPINVAAASVASIAIDALREIFI